MKKSISLLMALVLLISLMAGCASNSNNGPVSTELGQSEKVVILVLDAMSSSYLSQLGEKSNLAKIAKDGACNLDARCVYPSQTLTNHTTIMTGVSSGVHGIIGNVRLGEDGLTTIRNRDPEMIQVETIFEIARHRARRLPSCPARIIWFGCLLPAAMWVPAISSLLTI